MIPFFLLFCSLLVIPLYLLDSVALHSPLRSAIRFDVCFFSFLLSRYSFSWFLFVDDSCYGNVTALNIACYFSSYFFYFFLKYNSDVFSLFFLSLSLVFYFLLCARAFNSRFIHLYSICSLSICECFWDWINLERTTMKWILRKPNYKSNKCSRQKKMMNRRLNKIDKHAVCFSFHFVPLHFVLFFVIANVISNPHTNRNRFLPILSLCVHFDKHSQWLHCRTTLKYRRKKRVK